MYTLHFLMCRWQWSQVEFEFEIFVMLYNSEWVASTVYGSTQSLVGFIIDVVSTW